MRTPLPKKLIVHSEWVHKEHPEYIAKWERVMFFDPTEIYNRIDKYIKPTQRHLSISIGHFFPDIEGQCACGCGQMLEGRRERWATPECKGFAYDVHNIICNIHQRAAFYVKKYFGDVCIHCNECDGEELDHIVGVKQGGSGGWLSNYQWVCKKCHRKKTNKDFGFKENKK